MILLISTIKGKHEAKTASKWKGGGTPPTMFPFNSSSRWEKLSPPPASLSVSSRGGGGTPTTLHHIFCLRFTGPPRPPPLRGNIDGLVLKVKASRATRRLPLFYASSLFPFDPERPLRWFLFLIKSCLHWSIIPRINRCKVMAQTPLVLIQTARLS